MRAVAGFARGPFDKGEDHGFARFGLGGAKEVRLLALGHVVLPCFDYTSGAVILHDLPHAHGSLPVGFLVASGDREDEPLNVRIGRGCARSEEHTSELQSLMRISYAVFCLKKKKKKQITETNKTTPQT